jgi:integral membrane protein
VRAPAYTATPLGRFRVVAYWEGISYLVLLFVAMPLKYALGFAMAVRVVGAVHGALFIAYLATLALAANVLGVRRLGLALLVSFIPGGTFWLEARLQREEIEPVTPRPLDSGA